MEDTVFDEVDIVDVVSKVAACRFYLISTLPTKMVSMRTLSTLGGATKEN